VDAICGYNDRLFNILNIEKSKDAAMRELEETLFGDKLQHAELIANVSFGHELMKIEDACDKEYSELELGHESTAGQLREIMQEYEEVYARVSVAEVDGAMLQSQLQDAKTRENHMKTIIENYNTKLDTLKANEQAAASRTKALNEQCDETREKHSKEFANRPANQAERKNGDEIIELVKKAQDLRSEHAKIMHDLHEIESKEIKQYEAEANRKLAEFEEKLRAQFSKEEMKRIAKHNTHKQELEAERERLEQKTKAEMEAREKNLRNKIKKLTLQRSKMSVSIETMRQQVVDFLAEKNVQSTQMKHLEAMAIERSKTLEKIAKEHKSLENELTSTQSISDAAAKNCKMVAQKYRSVIKQNEKMAKEITKFNALVTQGEEELEFSPPNKRIRSTKLA
jgi:chromosome segregation ATPase